MTSPLVAALIERQGLPLVDEATIDAFLAPAQGEAEHAVLFFTGDATQRGETDDVAVILPELLRAFAGKLRGAVVARQAEAGLKSRFQVFVMPSLAVTRGADPVGVLPKIADWSEYMEKIAAFLASGAPILTASKGPRVEFIHSHSHGE